MKKDQSQTDNLKSIKYNPEQKILEIQFHSGGIHQYSAVPAQIYADLLACEYKTAYINQYLKNKYHRKSILII